MDSDNAGSSVENGEEVFLGDGSSLREFVAYLIAEPNPWRLPGSDRIDTIIALVAAVAPHVEEIDRYAALMNRIRLDEHCKELGLAFPAPTEPFVGEYFRCETGAQVALIWSDNRGPTKSIHRVRRRGGVTSHVWNRQR